VSIVCFLQRAADQQLDQLLAKPVLIEPFLYGPDRDRHPVLAFVMLLMTRSPRVAWAMVLDKLGKPRPRRPRVELPPEWPEAKEEDELYLGQTWEGIHFMLTGANQAGGDEPLCYLTRGGQDIGEVDVGYGPARALKSGRVKAFAEALMGISQDEFRRRFSAKEIVQAGIYPPHLGEEGEHDPDCLAGYFAKLKPFVTATAKAGLGLVVWLC